MAAVQVMPLDDQTLLTPCLAAAHIGDAIHRRQTVGAVSFEAQTPTTRRMETRAQQGYEETLPGFYFEGVAVDDDAHWEALVAARPLRGGFRHGRNL